MSDRTATRRWVSVLVALGLLALPGAWTQADDKPQSTAVKPVPKDVKRHEKFVEIAGKGHIDVLFLGDSITDAWGGEGHNPKAAGSKLFASEFEPMHAANFGIGGDRTQHVLWRLQNGELDGIHPKVVMLMIGTNNSNGKDNTAEEIADGIKAIVHEIHHRSPHTKVLLLAIFPRHTGKTPEANEAQMDKIRKVNDIVSKLDDGGKTVKYLDIGDKFMVSEKGGTIPRDIMPDQLHLSPKGYQIWADAVKGPIEELLGKK
jgi:lysophospholipase L1-like esterase